MLNILFAILKTLDCMFMASVRTLNVYVDNIDPYLFLTSKNQVFQTLFFQIKFFINFNKLNFIPNLIIMTAYERAITNSLTLKWTIFKRSKFKRPAWKILYGQYVSSIHGKPNFIFQALI